MIEVDQDKESIASYSCRDEGKLLFTVTHTSKENNQYIY